MVPELGYFFLIIASCFSFLQAFVPAYGFLAKNYFYINQATSYTRVVFIFTLFSFLSLMYSFAADDFTVNYVAANSNLYLPLYYKLPAVWGGHEGSLLLWFFILSIWSFLLSLKRRVINREFLEQTLCILGFIAFGFSLFIIFTSNPFIRNPLVDPSFTGADLNPLLQDFGLIIHPPILYAGYVGLSVPFAFAISALLREKFYSLWIVWCRPWALAAVGFLTVGITLGSWWAYYELGWGGWWFWDPVENASFMPWLLGVALLHSLFLNNNRGVFYSWTILLAIFAFSLSLLGTFIVRSGVLTSVHSFASDPKRGLFILFLVSVFMASSLFIYAVKSQKLKRSSSSFHLLSKDFFLVLGNILLITASFSVLVGTLYPIFFEILGYGKVSVGPPYFNAIFVPIALLVAFFMGISPLFNWKKGSSKSLFLICTLNLFFSIISSSLFFYFSGFPVLLLSFLGILAAFWIFFPIFFFLLKVFFAHSSSFNFKKIAMSIAHLGVAMSIFGISMTVNYSEESSVSMAVNDSSTLKDYTFKLVSSASAIKENYTTEIFNFKVSGDSFSFNIFPEKRFYGVRGGRMTEAGINWGLTRDIYVAVGENLDNDRFAVRLSYKPFIRLLWLGGIFIALGILFAFIDARVINYRL